MWQGTCEHDIRETHAHSRVQQKADMSEFQKKMRGCHHTTERLYSCSSDTKVLSSSSKVWYRNRAQANEFPVTCLCMSREEIINTVFGHEMRGHVGVDFVLDVTKYPERICHVKERR